MLIYFIGQASRAGNNLSAVRRANTSRIKAKKILKALKKCPEILHSCQQHLKQTIKCSQTKTRNIPRNQRSSVWIRFGRIIAGLPERQNFPYKIFLEGVLNSSFFSIKT